MIRHIVLIRFRPDGERTIPLTVSIGGTIDLRSVPGQGTRLEIGLPGCPAPDAVTS